MKPNKILGIEIAEKHLFETGALSMLLEVTQIQDNNI